MDRKAFIKTSCGFLGAVALASLLDSCKKDEPTTAPEVNFDIDLSSSSNATLKTVGGFVSKNGVLVICTATDTYVALSQKCTHQGCTVAYNKSSTKLECPCHGGVYDINGNVVSGPPPSALHKYNVTKNGNILTIK